LREGTRKPLAAPLQLQLQRRGVGRRRAELRDAGDLPHARPGPRRVRREARWPVHDPQANPRGEAPPGGRLVRAGPPRGRPHRALPAVAGQGPAGRPGSRLRWAFVFAGKRRPPLGPRDRLKFHTALYTCVSNAWNVRTDFTSKNGKICVA
jgi:hypothetical protein